jgi:hypothetical protein
MRLHEFAGVSLPDAQAVSDLSREVLTASLRPTGQPFGDYYLYGSSSPFGMQTYRHEFLYSAASQTTIDALMAKIGVRGTLKQTCWDASTRQTEAILVRVTRATTVEDKHAGIQRMNCEFLAEPFWYATTLTTVAFTSTTSVALSGSNGNAGNARAIKGLVLTITSNLPSATTITLTPSSGTASSIVYIEASTGTLVVDAGAHTVKLAGVNKYAKTSRADTQVPLLFLEPGNSTLTATNAITGSIAFRSCWR